MTGRFFTEAPRYHETRVREHEKQKLHLLSKMKTSVILHEDHSAQTRVLDTPLSDHSSPPLCFSTGAPTAAMKEKLCLYEEDCPYLSLRYPKGVIGKEDGSSAPWSMCQWGSSTCRSPLDGHQGGPVTMSGATVQPQIHSCCFYVSVCQKCITTRSSIGQHLHWSGLWKNVQIPGFPMALTPLASHLPQALSRGKWTNHWSLSIPGLSSRSGHGSPTSPDLSKDPWKSCHHLTAAQKLQPGHNNILGGKCVHFCLSKGRLMAEWKCLLNVLNGNEWSLVQIQVGIAAQVHKWLQGELFTGSFQSH